MRMRSHADVLTYRMNLQIGLSVTLVMVVTTNLASPISYVIFAFAFGKPNCRFPQSECDHVSFMFYHLFMYHNIG